MGQQHRGRLGQQAAHHRVAVVRDALDPLHFPRWVEPRHQSGPDGLPVREPVGIVDYDDKGRRQHRPDAPERSPTGGTKTRRLLRSARTAARRIKGRHRTRHRALALQKSTPTQRSPIPPPRPVPAAGASRRQHPYPRLASSVAMRETTESPTDQLDNQAARRIIQPNDLSSIYGTITRGVFAEGHCSSVISACAMRGAAVTNIKFSIM